MSQTPQFSPSLEQQIAAFTEPEAEYWATVNSAGLFDRTTTGKLELTGDEAPKFISNLSTNIVETLPLGGGCPTYFCDHRAKALFQAVVYHIRLQDGQHALWVETTPGRQQALYQHLDKYLISEAAEIADVSEPFAQMHLAGPKAKEILESALAAELPELSEYQHLERTFGSSSTCHIRCRHLLGLPGYDLVCLKDRAAGIWRMLVAAGATPAGAETYETLRIEAGTPEYGKDFDETRFVMEIAGAEKAVSYSKGCYLGQEPIVMSRDRAGHAPRQQVRLHLPEPSMLDSSAKVFAGEEEIGIVTSSTPSRRHRGVVALAYVKWKFREANTELLVLSGVVRHPAKVMGI